MRVATWNVNNVLKRLDLLLDWLARTKPDVVALQELKTVTEAFPVDTLKAAGYSSLVVGQRSWNGVALLARDHEIVPVIRALPGDPSDKEAWYVEAAIGGVLFSCLYLVNGNPQPGPKFAYKLAWFERMRKRAAELWASGKLKSLAAELESLGITNVWLDGEMVVLNEHGVPDFNKLQSLRTDLAHERVLLKSKLLAVEGTWQFRDGVAALKVRKGRDLTPMLVRLASSTSSRDFR